jgi:hypothetical protein
MFHEAMSDNYISPEARYGKAVLMTALFFGEEDELIHS